MQIFFIILRETLESAIIISVLLSLVKQTFTTKSTTTGEDVLTISKKAYKQYWTQVWIGAISGLALCTGLGVVFIAVFYLIGSDIWSLAERVWEGFFSILSALIIAVMGVALLRVNTLQSKWRWKLGRSLHGARIQNSETGDSNVESCRGRNLNPVDESNCEDERALQSLRNEPLYSDMTKFVSIKKKLRHLNEKYALVILPFITTLREGLEAVVFVGGIGVDQPARSFPLAIVAGAIIGIGIGVAMYKGGNQMSLQVFLIASSCFLYLVAAGLMSKGVWFFELEHFVEKCGQDTSETGSGPGSYDISNTLWHVNCCNGLTDGGWMLFNALLGWTNTATYGSVSSYIIFWLAVIMFLKIRLRWERYGYNSMLPIRWQIGSIKKRIIADRLLYQEYIDLKNGTGTCSPSNTSRAIESSGGERKAFHVTNNDGSLPLVPSTANSDETDALLTDCH